MGLKRYLDIKNWFSDDIILLLKREPKDFKMPELREGRSIAAVSMSNVEDTQRFEGKQYVEIYKKFLLHGDYGFFAYVDGQCVARCWGVTNPVDVTEGGVSLGLEEDAIFVHYVETDKEYRGMGLGKACLAGLVNQCKDHIMYVTINMNNGPSLCIHKKYMGFKEAGVIKIKQRFMKCYTTLYKFDEI